MYSYHVLTDKSLIEHLWDMVERFVCVQGPVQPISELGIAIKMAWFSILPEVFQLLMELMLMHFTRLEVSYIILGTYPIYIYIHSLTFINKEKWQRLRNIVDTFANFTVECLENFSFSVNSFIIGILIIWTLFYFLCMLM